MEHQRQITSAIENGYDFQASKYISAGFDIFKNNAGGFIGYTFIFMIATMIINSIPFLGYLINIVVSPALMVGFAIAAHKQINNNDLEFGNFFKGFDHITQLLIANIIMTLIYIIVSLPIIFKLGISIVVALASGDQSELFEIFDDMTGLGVWFGLTMILFLYVMISMRWTNFLIVFHQYDAITAIKTSWQLTNKQWFSHFIFILLVGLVILGGIILLIVGVVLAYPIVMAADYAGYADVTRLNDNSDVLDEIGQNSEFLV
ncbi:MAG: hypothetical protein IPN86_05660 [Saprospiraceae bacterium]|nr:hypothetical protein [Saprospiraceae bacterium]